MTFQIKRIYDTALESDGKRFLVDRLWPRGISKERAALDGWLKDLTPSDQLRKWFGHKAENFEEFSVRYRAELDENEKAQIAAKQLLRDSKKERSLCSMLQKTQRLITLLY